MAVGRLAYRAQEFGAACGPIAAPCLSSRTSERWPCHPALARASVGIDRPGGLACLNAGKAVQFSLHSPRRGRRQAGKAALGALRDDSRTTDALGALEVSTAEGSGAE